MDVVNVTLEGLSPSTMYNCSLLANNSVGSGPSSHLTITMEDDGEDHTYLGINCITITTNV